ncbi:MAG TPA: MG2 domain-containing protein [Candidatus Acidoferrales bacterium]|nr:MG2 domain-containing protein [Candidatus Acidoferrales bacterium]
MRYVASRAVCLLLPLLVLFAIPCRAQNTIAVNEPQIRIQITPDATIVRLPVSNSSGQHVEARVTLELLDPHGVVQTQSARDVTLSRGLTKLEISLPPAPEQMKSSGLSDILWYRLRYSIVPKASIAAPAASGTATRAVEGIISVSESTPDIFELHVAGPAFVKDSGHYLARVRAIQPVTGHPVAGVAIDASLDLDAEDGKPLLPRPATTNRSGFATIEFTLPPQVDTDEIDATFTGKLRGFVTSADGEFQVNHFSNVTLSTDKPIYQPGQTLHVRLMAFDTKKKAISSEPVTVKITDPDDTLVYQATAQTSAFGIASADWQIPQNLRLGTFQLQASFGEGRYEDASASASVKISRYELPAFTVIPKPDRGSYLPGQDATVEIRADYLFGKPVLRGQVRLVRESNREWNYRKQKWDVDEDEHWEGDTDSQGRFTAHIDLAKDHAALADADYERFHDISLAAYFTDSSTGRTEQRRFDLRLTKYPIHIYVIGANGGAARGLPLEFYVSTDYADGAPASCDVEIEWLNPSHMDSRGSVSSSPQIIRRVRTNRYGVAKVSGLVLPSDTGNDDFALNFIARDHKGLVARHTESIYSGYSPVIRVETDKTLYKLGEPISVRLATAEPGVAVIVEAIHDGLVVASQLVHVRNGHADLEFAANDQYQNEVTILAYSFGFKESDEYSKSEVSSAHTVYFPKDTQLQVSVKFAKSSYRPGDQAVADFHVTEPDGAHSKAALGLVVVDQAVEERARTDQDFGGRGGFYNFLSIFDDPEEIGGIRKADLDKIDMSKPLPEGLDLVAEVLLQGNSPWPSTFSSETYDRDLKTIFGSEIYAKIQPVREALMSRYDLKGDYPKDQASLDSILAPAGIHFADVKDPWGTPYHARFSVSREHDVLEIFSAGPDKQFGTEDDFTVAQMSWNYFKPVYEALRHAIFAYHDRTGGFIRDAATLKSELAPSGFDFDTLKDPWGHLYRVAFGVNRSEFTVSVSSAGPDGRFSTDANPSNDDFPLATIGIDYFADTRAKLDAALTDYFRKTQIFPETLDELKKALAGAGIDFDSLRDPWGHPFYATFNQEARYSDDLSVETYEQYQSAAGQHSKIVPVTQRINWVYIRSAGVDGVAGTADDFTVASFARGVVEQSSREKTPVSIANQPVLTGATGAITGTITDPTGAVIAGATISAKNSVTGETFTATSDSEGNYVVKDLPAGFYIVQISMMGFQTFSVTHVPVRSSNVTHLNATLSVGVAEETVEVTAQAISSIETTTSSVAAIGKPGTAKLSLPELAATPRLREYFPETLLWRPEVVTDNKGFSQVKFPLADNITTWKLSAVASTQSGEIGTADKDLRTFQPFFVEHDPPPVLTVGDEIALPVVLRNYLDRALQVNVEMKPASWFSLLGSGTAKSQVPSGDSSRDIFRFRADSATSDGKQQVVAIGAGASDAISRSVRVHPNGEEKSVSSSEVFSGPATVDLAIPATAIPGSIETTLKIYPNLNAHVLESIEAILERPYGCGEQTISSTYPSILLLESAKSAGTEKSPLVARAHRYAEMGYERLLSYRSPDGGFSYWGKGNSDFALTVYAIHFLSDAREFVPVDEAVIQGAVTWVVNKIQPDGHWSALDWNGKEDARRSVMLTAYIARMLAESEPSSAASGANPQVQKVATEAVHRALAFLKPQIDAFDEPYAIASYALASNSAHDVSAFENSIVRLRSLEHHEGDASYWALETNTPFYGWGLAGRLETTAVVLQALAKAPGSTGDDALISRGLLFLLRNQDRYGIWYSTQATIDVLHAMQSLTSLSAANSAATAAASKSGSKAQINVDGARALTVDLPPANALTGPVEVDLSKFVAAGNHRVEIVRPADSPRASLQIVADYYVPWAHSSEVTDTLSQTAFHQDEKASDALRLSINFSAQSANVGDTIQCTVSAERIGFRGYGMLLAEIGLPPGADVDRNSLDTAMKSSWDINEYDVLPDKLIVYLWPRAGGTKFSFTFKPRFGMKALTAPSVLYDYYNPEARAVVEPSIFTVR